jgi:integrase
MGRETSARQTQAHPLVWKEIKDFIDTAGMSLRADRERAMLCIAYETLARRAELVALMFKDIDFSSRRHWSGAHPSWQDRRRGAGKGGVFVARDLPVAQDLA